VTISHIYNAILRRCFKKTFRFWNRLGLNLIPNHFYEPIPNIRDLAKHNWDNMSEMVGIDLNIETQLSFLRDKIPQFREEYNFPDKQTNVPYEFHLNNGLFESVDAEILHCMIRAYNPKRIVEIGSGYTTYLSAKAALLNSKIDQVATELIAIEPFPDKTLKRGFPGLAELRQTAVEEVGLQLFQSLNENDILFIDSSHVVRIANDVIYEYMEILPRLKKGVIVHIHDIFLPTDYPKEWILNEYRFWTEQYLLQAFMCYNDAFEVLWSSSAMHFYHPEKVEAAFPSWKNSFTRMPWKLKRVTPSFDKKNVWPCSFWIRKIKQL